MTAKQVRDSFKAHARPSLVDNIKEALAEFQRRIKENPNEAREFLVRAGIKTPTGRWTKPMRMLAKRDLEEQAEREAAEAAAAKARG